jgi:PLP dependent protein
MGKLQSNKAKIAAKYFDMIQSVDSIKLAKRLNRFCGELSRKMPILIQINIGDEPQKAGIAVSQVEVTLDTIILLDNLIIKGFMCIQPFDEPPDPYFKKMKEIFDIYREKYKLSVLSMGMSADYEQAIALGSNMVRVGTKIFGART